MMLPLYLLKMLAYQQFHTPASFLTFQVFKSDDPWPRRMLQSKAIYASLWGRWTKINPNASSNHVFVNGLCNPLSSWVQRGTSLCFLNMIELPFSRCFAIVYSFIPLIIEYMRAGYLGIKGDGNPWRLEICYKNYIRL